jgi:hypothetical protein
MRLIDGLFLVNNSYTEFHGIRRDIIVPDNTSQTDVVSKLGILFLFL